MTIRDITAYLEEIAPACMAEEWDNTGLLVGSNARTVDTVLVCLDITAQAVEKAKREGAGLIISHHPVIFHPINRLAGRDIPYQLAAAGVAAYCAHTNLDKAPGGVGDTLAGHLGLLDVRSYLDGTVKVGTLPGEESPADFARRMGTILNTPVRVCQGKRPVKAVALVPGAGGEYLADIREICEIDAFVTGEIRHHEWLEAGEVTLLDAGHYATEQPVVEALTERLSKRFPSVRFIPFTSGAPYQMI